MGKKVLTTGKFVFDGVSYGVTAMNHDKNADEVEVTDTNTSGNEKEYLAGRQERTFSVDIFKDVTQADPLLSTVAAGSLDFEGFSYAGDMIILSISNQADIDDGVKMTIEGRLSGAVVETPETP